jgi:hypothetical protein
MKKLILASALGAATLALAACGDGADTDEAADTAAVETAPVETADTAATEWPAGTRIVDEGGTTYRVNADGTRVAISDGSWRIVSEGDTRYRVGTDGVRYEINDEGEDLDGAPDGGPGDVDVDLGTNASGNLDLDVSTDGTDASPEDSR